MIDKCTASLPLADEPYDDFSKTFRVIFPHVKTKHILLSTISPKLGFFFSKKIYSETIKDTNNIQFHTALF